MACCSGTLEKLSASDAVPIPLPASEPGDAAWPDDAVEVGKVLGPYGVKGWIRVQPYAADAQALFASRHWLLKAPELRQPALNLPSALQIVELRRHGDSVVANAQGVADRAQAEALKGARLFVSRARFPAPAADEYYWVDLIGLDVVNRQGEALGKVVDLVDTGPHSVLRVQGATPDAPERLIPFVAAYVDEVDLPLRRITVDWSLDY
jgi:16S rRNA processing protein RimM